MISKGFHDLKVADAEAAFRVVVDILAGIHEFVPFPLSLSLFKLIFRLCATDLTWLAAFSLFRNDTLRANLNASGRVPYTLIKRTTTRDPSSGKLVVTEHADDTDPSSSSSSTAPPSSTSSTTTPAGAEAAKSPITEMLYMRWMEGLKLRWPGS
jgi:serine/threonine-protein kinase 24/25/MST4